MEQCSFMQAWKGENLKVNNGYYNKTYKNIADIKYHRFHLFIQQRTFTESLCQGAN